MTVFELGILLQKVGKIYGPDISLHYEDLSIIIKDKNSHRILQINMPNGKLGSVWLRWDTMPPEKKAEVEKELQLDRAENIIT